MTGQEVTILTPEQAIQARDEFFQWFDKLPRVRREFIAHYGIDAYLLWKRLAREGKQIPLRIFEIEYRRSKNLSPTSPVVDEYEKGQY